ncbi:MoaD/ThiS family protein [Sphingobacterium thalpophilum]|uniref:MoaD/ThiS family protein n=1 Tax=Sphingobacterium thalpophilum TaxID=259 RepID=A0A4U9VRA5_9SPHI|nr:MoaD/ThiS family protein [Sphingobacterium thalpophilum]VTR49900.1 Sulfur carrier protein moaD [Sphingobacterium thalpophilum]
MKVKVKTFGSLTELLEKEFYITAVDTADLVATLTAQQPALANRSLLIAVNNTLVKETTALAADDIVALMPPYSGG